MKRMLLFVFECLVVVSLGYCIIWVFDRIEPYVGGPVVYGLPLIKWLYVLGGALVGGYTIKYWRTSNSQISTLPYVIVIILWPLFMLFYYTLRVLSAFGNSWAQTLVGNR